VTVSRLAFRRTWKGAVAVAAANVLVTVTAVIGYVAAYPDPVDRVTLASSIGSNPGLTALFGQTRALETIAGFTEWRVVLVLALVGAVWALFAVTRALRGEEDDGRADVVLAGPITRSGATLASLLGITASLGLMLLVSVVGMTLGAGGDLGVDRAALLGVTVVSTPAVMVGVGAVTSQVADTRRRAAGMAAAVLGASYLLRVVADSAAGLGWLRWATALGWLELAHPLTEPTVLPILLSYAMALALGILACLLVGARDTGAGLSAAVGARRARTTGLGSPLGLAARLAVGPALAWALGLALFGMLIGLVARTAAQAMADSTGGDLLGRLGIEESGTRAYVGVSFVLVTLALTTAAAGQVAATRDEEAASRLDTLLVHPVGRRRWLAGRLTVSVGVLVLAVTAAVLGTWAAGSAGGLGVGVGDLAAAGVNTVPAAVFVLGAGTLAHGVVPRMAIPLTYTLVAGSFLLEVVGAAVSLPSWVLNLSVLHHVAPAPAVSPDWRSAAGLVLLGVLLAAGGAAALSRRDVEPA
jgi:ABC-2 type transport system permease protein